MERGPAALSRPEVLGLSALGAAMLLLRVACSFSHRFNTDEPQHLHIAWAWTQGLLPYRDVFDNHAPLFHFLSAPLVALIGEDPRILVFMRLALIPLTAATLGGTFILGRRLFGARAGLWAAVLCGLSPTFFFKSLEYRTDVLWAALWVLAVAVFLSGPPAPGRWLLGGLLLGTCLAVSIKTAILLGSLGLAVAGVLILGARVPRIAAPACAAAAGVALPPAAIVLWFWSRGALAELYSCVVAHNLLPGAGRWGSKRQVLLVPLLALLFLAARLVARRLPERGLPIAFLLLLAGSHYALLATVWPIHSRQDLLPFYPLSTVLLAGGLLAWRRGGVGATAALACLLLLILPAVSPPGGRGAHSQIRLLDEVLRLTDISDPVLDLKGQAVFRNRPFYYALETMTLQRMARGLIPDRIPERCIETRTCVAPADIKGFPPRARRFLEEHYVVVGAWRVAGVVLDPAAREADAPLSFEIAIPARYAAVAGGAGPARGTLDGAAIDGPRELAPGRHEYRPAPRDGPIAIIWSQAVERGFTPFAKDADSP